MSVARNVSSARTQATGDAPVGAVCVHSTSASVPKKYIVGPAVVCVCCVESSDESYRLSCQTVTEMKMKPCA